jgi:outer membrane protein assembly factor BamD
MARSATRVLTLILLVLILGMTANAQWVYSPQIGRLINVKRLPKETPELQVEYARSLMAAGDYKGAMRETRKFEEFYSDSDYADDNQFVRGEIRMAQGKYEDAAKEFQLVITSFPESELFDDVITKQYELGDLYYARGQANLEKGWWKRFKRKPFEKAIAVYTMVIDNQPFTDAAAEAQYKVGLCRYTLEDYVEAAFEYRRVVEDYAKSGWVDEAKYGLAMCYYESSLPAEYDQGPSLLAVKAIDEFKEQFPGDHRIPELDAKRVEARSVVAEQRLQTAQFYERRRKFKAAAIYYEVVADEFSDTPAATVAKAWIDQNTAGARQAGL